MSDNSKITDNSRRLAIFDLDYTLTRKGTWGRFVWLNVRFKPWLWVPLLLAAAWAQWRYKQGYIERVRVKMAMMRWSIKGKTKTQLTKTAIKFADNEVPDRLRPGGLEALRQHQAAGDTVIIVSAAVDILVKEISNQLGIEHYLATDMKWDEHQIVELDFASPNCYGPEKVRRLEQFFEQHPQMSKLPRIMYSDSHSDLDIMLYCDEAVAVHPSKKLEKLAKEHGFPIVNWD